MNPKDPQQVYGDVLDCAARNGGKRVRFSYDPKELRALALIAYDTDTVARRKLAPLRRCLEGKKNKIDQDGVAQRAQELGLKRR
jgi:hypothetical protein